MNRGLLPTLTEPPAGMDEEFNAWYGDEHLAERFAIPGFRSAQRWVADVPPGAGRYLATYELDSVAVLAAAAYLQRFENPTPSKALLVNGEAAGALQRRVFTALTGERIVLSELSNPAKTSDGIVYRLYQP